jgi:dTMP kinase
VLRPSIEEGKIVLSDRYADATVAYQGAGRGFSRKVIESVVRLATEGLKPGLTLLFDLPVEECLARTRRRGVEGRDRLDSEGAEFHVKVRERYLGIAATEPNRVKIISADGTLNQTHAKVLDVVMPFLQIQKRTSVR